MKFKTILLTALLIPTAAMAGWQVNQHGAALVPDTRDRSLAAVYSSKAFEIVDIKDECNPNDSPYAEGPIKVNGTFVNFKSYCHDDMRAMAKSPSTEKGKAFVIKEFSNKTTVTIGSTIFSAAGFNKAMKDQDAHIEASQNAL